MRDFVGSPDYPIWRQGQDLHVSHPKLEWLEEEIYAKAHQRGMGFAAHEAVWLR